MEGEKRKITVIDDNKGLVDTIKDFLAERGFAVSVAYDGKEGYDVVKRESPDVIILDIMMPAMDGRDLLSKIKKDAQTKDIPVIMLTAKDDQFDRDNSMELGAYEYVTKPYDSSILLRQINNVIDKKKRGEL